MKISELFFSADVDKSTLHRRITPTQKQREIQSERWNDLCEYLKGDLAEKTGFPIYSWLQGSYKMGTQIRPPKKGGEFDIDLGIYFQWSGQPTDKNLPPEYLKSLVQKSLIAYGSEVDDATVELNPKERCNRVHYSGDFHIDIPTYHIDADRDIRSLATQTKGWENSDPKKLYVWFRERVNDEDDTQLQRIIRYLKMYFALRPSEDGPSSILLTVLAVEAYQSLSNAETESDDTALRHVSEAIALRLSGNPKVPNPVNDSENLNRLDENAHDVFVNHLWSLVELADRALASDSRFETAAIWGEAFYHFFPSAIENTSSPVNKAIIPVAFVPVVDVVAVSQTNSNVAPFRGVDRIGPIPKQCTITFTLRNASSLPVGAQIHWMVRNEGEEAELTNDLGHPAGTGNIGREEHSAYHGNHFMDVTIFSSYGAVLGFSRIPVSIHGVAVPPRNPKKPGYIRYGKKR